MAKIEVILPLVELISKKESLYIDALDKKDPALNRRDLAGINEATEMPGRNKDTKIPDVRHIFPKCKHTTSNRSRSRIQSIQNRLKLIEFNNEKRRQADELVDKENTIAYIADIPIELNNNCLLFKNIMEYAWAKFMQTSKLSKKLINMFFNNPDLAPMQQYLSYKNVDKIRASLMELPYVKIT